MDSMENFKTAQQVGKMTNSLVYELASTTVEGSAVDGKVKVIFDGQQRPVNVQIDEAYLEQVDSSDLSAALTTAMKDAYRKSSERMDEKMKSFYVDLGLK
jgi:nucleoid-associated protein EbfC